MARPLTAHMIYLIIPGVKECISLSAIIAAVRKTCENKFSQDILYGLLAIVEGRVGKSQCV